MIRLVFRFAFILVLLASAGDVGAVVERHTVPDKEIGYSVEFFDMTGRTVAVVSLPASLLRAPTSSDRPSARTLAAAGGS